jgi:RNase P subunit RPR2
MMLRPTGQRILTCAACGETRRVASGVKPKELARELGWVHGDAKGIWICKDCKEYLTLGQED